MRKPVAVEKLQERVERLYEELKLPERFSPSEYMEANPDVAINGIGAADHFLKWGRLEGRPLRNY